MKILFICRANVGRSQAAMALYNHMHLEHSDSAGTVVYQPEVSLKDREGAMNIVQAMSEQGLDISENYPKQVTESLIENYEKLIVMAEPETIPEWLRNNPKTELWTVQDAKGESIETTRRIVQEIKDRVALI